MGEERIVILKAVSFSLDITNFTRVRFGVDAFFYYRVGEIN